MGLVIAVVGILLVSTLVKTGGKIVYTFDDAYIHLALAENIARGHYGVNGGEASAPCSSVLWPFLLAPLCWLGLEEPAPLAINLVSTLVTLAALSQIAATVMTDFRPFARHVLTAWLVGLLTVAANLVPAIFSGLEHSLQLACATSVVVGVGELGRTGRMRHSTMAVLLLAPLVRYENLAVCAPALGVLAFSGKPRTALALGLGIVVLLGGYSCFLLTRGLAPLPSSVLLKSHFLHARGAPLAWLEQSARSLVALQGLRLVAAIALFAVAARIRQLDRHARMLAVFGSTVALLHLVVGQFDWYGRYSAYAWLSCLIVLLTLGATRLRAWLHARPILATVVLSCAICLLHLRELNNVWEVPFASRNVYEQQFQMHRFVTEDYRAPVAVNDIGWVSYKNDAYVLDLWGLAAPSAQAARSSGDAQWMETEAHSRGVRLAMLYSHWFPKLPRSWRAVATLRLSGRPVTVAGRSVTFYATDPSAVPRLTALLKQFRRRLPPRVRLTLASPALLDRQLSQHVPKLDAPVGWAGAEGLPRRHFVEYAE
ncbi:MAG: hypothetical protein JW940_14760 [Polyangiaceae bacterium]|nr:hypothetical protein [Polyangiaceae bacterium]